MSSIHSTECLMLFNFVAMRRTSSLFRHPIPVSIYGSTATIDDVNAQKLNVRLQTRYTTQSKRKPNEKREKETKKKTKMGKIHECENL